MFGRNLKQRFMGRPTHISWLPLGGKCFTLLIFLIVLIASEEIGPHQNFLRFGYGVNFKSNGLLHHNLDRVWVVHRISLPSVDEVDRLPSFPSGMLYDEIELRERDRVALHAGRNDCQKAAPRTE